jgi:hypothetical protein
LPDALEAVIRAAAGQFDQMRHQVARDCLRVHEVRQAEFARQRFARRVEVDAYDHVGARHARALDHIEPDASESEHDDICARLDLGRVDHGTDTGGHAAADVAHLVERRVVTNLRNGDFRQHREIRKGRASHVVIERFAVERKRLVPSGITPLPWVARMAVQRLVLRDRHDLHCRHSGV